jgi:hypothetical protein
VEEEIPWQKPIENEKVGQGERACKKIPEKHKWEPTAVLRLIMSNSSEKMIQMKTKKPLVDLLWTVLGPEEQILGHRGLKNEW